MSVPQYPRPPFKPQQRQAFPGNTAPMHPRPDDGELGSGIGAAVAITFAREGADLAIAFLPSEEADPQRTGTLAEQAGRNAVPVRCEIDDADQAAALVDAVAGALGGLDVPVSNAAQASAYVMLASDRASFVSGAPLTIAGGAATP